MRVHLKGVHKVTVKLAGGTTATYFYAWRKGPRLVGEPGSPEFVASYYAAHQSQRESDRSRFHSITAGYKASQDFHGLKPRTRTDYLQHIARIETKFGDLPLAALADARVTRDFLEWRDGMAHSPRQADYGWMVLMRVLSWARARGLTLYRPPERVERLYHADRSEKIWNAQDIAAFLGKASEPLQRALVLAHETGQRQGDLLVLPWSAYQADEQGAFGFGFAKPRPAGASMYPSPNACALCSTTPRARRRLSSLTSAGTPGSRMLSARRGVTRRVRRRSWA